jgi:HPt (histidine-containing phosphotransfer) domain-containing protein
VSENDAPINVDGLFEQCMKDAEIVSIVLEKFERQLEADLQSLSATVQAGDSAAIARTAHGLKGAAGAVAATSLHAMSSALELLAKSGNLEAAAATLEGLRKEIARCAAYLPVARQNIGARAST